jgi:hypothetical protein
LVASTSAVKCTRLRIEVSIRREGEAVILEPVRRREWPRGFFERLRTHAHLFRDFEIPAPLPAGGTDGHLDGE